MVKKISIQLQYSIIFILTILLIAGSFIAEIMSLRDQVLRNEAETVANQVVAFRAWVAGTGMVWVNKLNPEFPDFLSESEGTHGSFYGKNPALATRELSTISNKIAGRASFQVTSDKYRQPANKPDDFESEAIETLKKDADLSFVDGYEGEKYRFIRPIFVTEGCLKCHGDPADAPPAVIEKYGSEVAFGYKVGDIRGIISVTLPAIGWKNILPILSNPIAIALLVLVFLLNFFFTKTVIIKRLVCLSRDITAISKGKLSTSLDYTSPDKSNDEIDHAYHAVNLLKRSMNIVLKKLRATPKKMK